MVHFGLLQTYPFFVIGEIEYDDYGYPTASESIMEFEGLIDYVSGNRQNDYMTIHPDTTHVIITNFSNELFDLLESTEGSYLEDGAGIEYKVLLVDDPGKQAHHLEIEVESVMNPIREENSEDMDGDSIG